MLNLKDINMTVKKGQLVAIVGRIGCGKSSLLSSLHGELYALPGTEITIGGSMAHVSQGIWIEAKSIRNNILFGQVYEEKRYNDCLKYSGLQADLEILPHKDDTMMGDKGVNLSGGQKLRVALARSFYQNKDIYLLDDPISSLDINVGTQVMEKGICGYLGGKTRVVTTHALPYLKFFDYIYIMEDGRIIEQGNYDHITASHAF